MVSPSPLNRLRRLLDNLEDDRAQTEERLPGRARRCRLLADPAEVETRCLEDGDGALEIGRHRHHVVECRDAVGVSGSSLRRGPVGAGRANPIEVRGLGDSPQRPGGDPEAGVSGREPDPGPVDDTGIAVDGEADLAPGGGGVDDRQLVESHWHGHTLARER